MDLRAPLHLAGQSLLAILDPEDGFLPTKGYEVAHDLGRWWDAVLRLEETLGFEIPLELEAAALGNLQRLTANPDALLIAPPERGGCINPHNFRESLLAWGGLVSHRRSQAAYKAGLRLVEAMNRALQADGSFDFTRLGSWGLAPLTTDPSHTEPRREGWFDATATSGRSLEALVWLYEATGEDRVLHLAKRIADHHLAQTISPDGKVRAEILDSENVGHNHSYHGTLRGLLLYGLLTEQPRFVEAVEATYRLGVRGQIVRESGWAPHDLGMMRFPNNHGDPVGEPASTGDSVQLALWLALRAGQKDLLDDVERLVRCRLLPMQMSQEEFEAYPEGTFMRRDLGAWGVHGECHSGKGCTPDITAAVTHTLCDVYHHICTHTAGTSWINLHFDYADDHLALTSRRAERGELTVVPVQPTNLMIRLPGWAPESSCS